MVGGVRRSLKVFLCHASGDKPPVREFYKRLVSEGVDAWLDNEKLLPGQDWRVEIPRAVEEADAVIVFLSNKSVTKEGYVQKEIKFALDIAEEKPEGTIFLIPARIEECTVPERLSRWQWVDLYEEDGYPKILRSLKLRADKMGAVIESASYVDTDKERERRLDQVYTEGLAAFYTEEWDKACQRFRAILSEQPNHAGATEKLAEAERQRNLAALYMEAVAAVRAENWQIAIRTLDELCQKSTDYKDVAQLLRNARKQKRLKELYAEASTLHAAQKWQAVVKVFGQISAIDPTYPDPDGLLSSAQKEVAELDRLAELNNLYSHAVREMDAGQWVAARTLLERIHKSQTGFLETERLLRKAETEIEKVEQERARNDQVNTLYEQAHGLMRAKKWRKAAEKIEQIKGLDEQFVDRDEIFRRAKFGLEREEGETQRENELAAMYAAAVRLLKDEKYQEALDKWQEVRKVDPKYPDRQWVQRTTRRKLARGSNAAVVQSDAKGLLKSVLTKWGAGSQAEVETSIVTQTRAGWLILFVALGWGVGRSLAEILGRVTNFFGLGVNFWSLEIIVGTFGLFYGVTIWLMLRLLKIMIVGKKGIVLIAGWLAGFLMVPVVGWFSGFSWGTGYILAGLVAGLCTAVVLRSQGLLRQMKQVIILVLGVTLSIYLGEKTFEVLQNVWAVENILVVEASFIVGVGSFISGLFCAWILVSQLSRRDESIDLAKQEWVILFVTTGWFLARLIAELIGYNLFFGVTFNVEHPSWPLKAVVVLLLSGALSGVVLWGGIQLATKLLTGKHLLLLALCWTGGMVLGGIPGIVLRSGETWLWSLGLGAGCSLATFLSLRSIDSAKIIVDRKHLIVVSIIIGLGFAIGNLWIGEIFGDGLRYMREDFALGVAAALQSALAGFLGITVLLCGKNEFNQARQLDWKIALGSALGFFFGDLLNVLVIKAPPDQNDIILIGFAFYGLFWGTFMMISTKSWKIILLFGIWGALATTGAMASWWSVSGNLELGRVMLYLVFGLFFGMMLSVGHRRSSAVILLCVASFFSLFIQHLILPNQVESTVPYWIGYFTRDLVLGGLIGLAWAYFLHLKPVSQKESIIVAENPGA